MLYRREVSSGEIIERLTEDIANENTGLGFVQKGLH